jgi:DNA primase
LGQCCQFYYGTRKLSYPEALRYLARKYNIEIEEQEHSPEEIKEKNERESLLAVNDLQLSNLLNGCIIVRMVKLLGLAT